jgi:hypothetical protein
VNIVECDGIEGGHYCETRTRTRTRTDPSGRDTVRSFQIPTISPSQPRVPQRPTQPSVPRRPTRPGVQPWYRHKVKPYQKQLEKPEQPEKPEKVQRIQEPTGLLTTQAPYKLVRHVVSDKLIRFTPRDKCPDLDSRVNKELIVEFNRRYSNLLKRNKDCRNFVVKNLRRRFKEESNKILPEDISTLTKKDVYDLIDLIGRVSNCPEVINLSSQSYDGTYNEEIDDRSTVTDKPVIPNVTPVDKLKDKPTVPEVKTPEYIPQKNMEFKPMDSSNNYGEFNTDNDSEVKNNYILSRFKYEEFYGKDKY